MSGTRESTVENDYRLLTFKLNDFQCLVRRLVVADPIIESMRPPIQRTRRTMTCRKENHVYMFTLFSSINLLVIHFTKKKKKILGVQII